MSTPGVLFNLTHCLYLDALLSCTCLLYSSLEHTHTSFVWEHSCYFWTHKWAFWIHMLLFWIHMLFFWIHMLLFWIHMLLFWIHLLLFVAMSCTVHMSVQYVKMSNTCVFNMLKCPTHVCSIRYNVNTCVFNDYTCRMIDWLIVNHGISLLGGTTLLLCYIIIIIYYLLYLSVHSSNTLFYCDALNVIYLFHVFYNLHSPYI